MRIIPVVLFMFLSGLGLFLSGCSLLSGSGAAIEAFNETKANVEKAQADLQKLAQEIADAKAAYDAAIKSGDKDKIGSAAAAVGVLLTKYDAALESFGSSKLALQAAVKRVEDAKGTDNYLWNILGVILGGIGGIAGGFGKWGKAASDLASGVKKIADNNVAFIPEDKLGEFKAALRHEMTPAEIVAIDRARGA